MAFDPHDLLPIPMTPLTLLFFFFTDQELPPNRVPSPSMVSLEPRKPQVETGSEGGRAGSPNFWV